AANLYGYCGAGSPCASGTCVELVPKYQADYAPGFCSQACTGACPQGGLCGRGPGGTNICFPSCSGQDYVCVDAGPVACTQTTDDKQCADCGCPSTQRCQAGVGCVDRLDMGASCSTDSDCKSNNCSTVFKTCRVPVGAACTIDNCDACWSNATGFSFWGRGCNTNEDCGNAGPCLGDAITGVYTCRPSCSGCPGTCSLTSDATTRYCYCPNCSIDTPKRPVGLVCFGSYDCQSNSCLGPACRSEDCGWCTKTCTADADC